METRKIFMKTAGGGRFPRLARVMTLALLMLTGLATGAKADDVLYAEVSGTEMTLKYGTKPSGATELGDGASWNSDFRSTVTTATVDVSCKNFAGESLAYLFYYMQNLTVINGLANLNTANVDNMVTMFYGCSKLTSLDLSTWNTAKVVRMGSMFQNCTNLATITVGSGWNTDAVQYSSNMFAGCSKLPNFNSSVVDKTNAHTSEGGYLTAAAPTAAEGFTATLAEGTEEADKWTIDPAEGLTEGQHVVATYSGSRRVKSVTATWTPAEEEASAVKVTAITLNKTTTTITKGSTETLSVSTVTPDDATDQTVNWISDNTGVATVDASTGVVTAVAAGTANITATANDGSGVTATCVVTVDPAFSFSKQDWYMEPSAPANFISVSQAGAKAAADAEKTRANAPGYVCIYALEDGQYKWIDSHGRTGQSSSIDGIANSDAWAEVNSCNSGGDDTCIWFTVSQ